MTILVDTTVIIDALRARRRPREFLIQSATDGHQLTTSAINVAETYSGMRDNERSEVEDLLGRFMVMDVTSEIAVKAGELRRRRKRSGVTIALMDALIAATAIHHNSSLMTDNIKDFPMEDLVFFPMPTTTE